MTKEAIRKVLNSEVSKSKKMLELYNGGLEVGEIAKLMQVRYNFVYNVVSNDCRKNGTAVRVTQKQGEVKAAIVQLLEQGKKKTEISKELSTNYNYVFKVEKEWEAAKRKAEAAAAN